MIRVIPLFSGSVTAFMRIEVKFSTTLTVKTGTLNIDILDWVTVIGDVTLKKENVFEARLAFGYDERDGEGVFRGAGALRVIPAGFGLDVSLGGLDERGAVLGLKIDSPVAIPLGSTGLGLKAIGGDFAYNFIARLDYKGSPVPSPNAANYVDWAANASAMEKWKPGPRNLTAVGVGVRTDIVTVADQGRLIKLTDAGLAQISTLRKLKFLTLSGRFTQRGLESLKRLTSLERKTWRVQRRSDSEAMAKFAAPLTALRSPPPVMPASQVAHTGEMTLWPPTP